MTGNFTDGRVRINRKAGIIQEFGCSSNIFHSSYGLWSPTHLTQASLWIHMHTSL